MKIIDDAERTVITHYRTIKIEDGPVISAGDSYVEGTQFRVERIKINRLEGKPAERVKLDGPRVDADGNTQHYGGSSALVMHELVVKFDNLPKAVLDIIKL